MFMYDPMCIMWVVLQAYIEPICSETGKMGCYTRSSIMERAAQPLQDKLARVSKCRSQNIRTHR